MNAISIGMMGPGYVLMLAAAWVVLMVMALAIAGVRRALDHRMRTARTVSGRPFAARARRA